MRRSQLPTPPRRRPGQVAHSEGQIEMTHVEKVQKLLARRGDDDRRRLALDGLDDQARRGHTWGTKEHRDESEETEALYDNLGRGYEKLSDSDIDLALAAESA